MSTGIYWFAGITLVVIALMWLFNYTEHKRWDWEESE